MKRFLVYILIFLAACTPQRQLARLLQRHPELQKDSVITFHDTIFTPYVKTAESFTFEDLQNLQDTNKHALPWSDLSNADHKTGITAVANGARASIIATETGFQLVAEQLPDTNALERSVVVPTYITKEIKTEVPIPQWKIFLMYLGGIFILEMLLKIVVFALKHFSKL